MRVELEIWRQDGPQAQGFFESHVVEDAEPQMSLLELLDRLNDQIIESGGEPVVFESDCREGVCGACGFLVNGVPHGPLDTTPACRQHLRAFPGVTRFRLEPWRSALSMGRIIFRSSVCSRTSLGVPSSSRIRLMKRSWGRFQVALSPVFAKRCGGRAPESTSAWGMAPFLRRSSRVISNASRPPMLWPYRMNFRAGVACTASVSRSTMVERFDSGCSVKRLPRPGSEAICRP